MSGYQPQYQTGGVVSGPGQNRSRPGALTAALAASGLVVLLVFISQVISLATGKDFLRDKAQEELGVSASTVSSSLFDAVIQDAYDTLKSRAIVGIVLALLVVLFTALAMRAGTGIRVTLAVVLLATAGLMIISVKDVFPAISKATGGLAIALAPIAVILLFLPAVNGYNKARKAPRAA